MGWYRGNEIEVDSYLSEVVALALPVQPICREDCAGLCPKCGADRNQAPCACGDSQVDPRWQALERLRES